MEKVKYNYLRRELPWPALTMKLRKDGEAQADAQPDVILLNIEDFVRLGDLGFLTGKAQDDWERVKGGERVEDVLGIEN